MASCGGQLGAAARVLRPAGSPLTSLRHPVDPRSSEDGWRTKLGTNSTAYQLPCQIRAVWRSAQRHQGGAHRAGDSRGAECHAALIPQGPDPTRPLIPQGASAKRLSPIRSGRSRYSIFTRRHRALARRCPRTIEPAKLWSVRSPGPHRTATRCGRPDPVPAQPGSRLHDRADPVCQWRYFHGLRAAMTCASSSGGTLSWPGRFQ